MNKRITLNLTRDALTLCLLMSLASMPASALVATTSVANANSTMPSQGCSSQQFDNPKCTDWMIPFQGSVYITSGDRTEQVDFAGSIHVVVKVFPTDPCISCVPPNPTRVQTNLAAVSGIGRTTGASYEATGAANFEAEVELPGSFTFQASYRVRLLPPAINGVPPNPILPIKYSVTLDAASNVTELSAAVGTGGDVERN